ncbi:hypothetical protein [Bradyrhizobium sp. S3.7.6]
MMAPTIIAAMYPRRYEDSYTEIFLKVWFEELSEPVEFLATLFDGEGHGRELWFRAMKGEYGPIEIIGTTLPLPPLPSPKSMKLIEGTIINQPKLLGHHAS